jgi:regulator of replication initiation timing
MRYPVGQLGTKEEFERLWYTAQSFGATTAYGFHEGWDLNLKTGADTDLGQPLYAVGTGRIVYFHNNSHPTKNFGKHMVLECDTPVGKRWYMYSHCQEIISKVKDVQKGEVIGKLGKSGTASAHLHFSVFKVDPGTLPSGIDTVAKTKKQLDDWWEDPSVSLSALDVVEEPSAPRWLLTLLQERGLTIESESAIRVIFEKAKNYDDEVPQLKQQVVSVNEALAARASEVSMLTERNQKLTDRVAEAEESFNRVRGERDKATWELSQEQLKNKKYEEEIASLTEAVTRLKENNDIYAYTFFERLLSLFGKGGGN